MRESPSIKEDPKVIYSPFTTMLVEIALLAVLLGIAGLVLGRTYGPDVSRNAGAGAESRRKEQGFKKAA
jgi:hypothetical protein